MEEDDRTSIMQLRAQLFLHWERKRFNAAYVCWESLPKDLRDVIFPLSLRMDMFLKFKAMGLLAP